MANALRTDYIRDIGRAPEIAQQNVLAKRQSREQTTGLKQQNTLRQREIDRFRFRAIKGLQERVLENGKITPVYDSIVTELGGRTSVDFLKVTNTKTKKIDLISCGAVFIFIGIEPNSQALKDLGERDEKGFIIVDKDMKSSRDGIYACGDVIKKDLYQIATAVGEGATAAFNARRYIEGLKGEAYP